MKLILDFLNQYGISLIHTIFVAILSYISLEIKKIYKHHITNKTKKEVIIFVCHAINELYPNESGENKLNLAITNAKQILTEKGITISDLELRMYIAGTVHLIKNQLVIHKNIDN